jgi:hypothetical protein
MDPLNPIVPFSNPTSGIPRTPAVPRVGPDEQRQQTRDDEHGEQEPDQESFDEALDEATSEDFSASEEFFIPEVDRSEPKPVVETPAEDRRTHEDGDDDDDPTSPHIDIIA